MSAPTRPQSVFFDSLEEFARWPASGRPSDAFSRILVPLRARPAAPAGIQVQHCHDYKNGYVADADLRPQGSTQPDTYNFQYWQYLDQFIYFSHHRVSLPTTWYGNAAHANGVPVLGTLIFDDNSESVADLRTLVKTSHPDGKPFLYVDQLVAAAKYFGFEGWLWNVESNLAPGLSATEVMAFVRALTVAMRQAIPGALCIWYDALTDAGEPRAFQNGLNSKNVGFYRATDGILANYGWTPQGGELKTSVETARAEHRPLSTVYTGIDVWGRSTYPEGDVTTPLGEIATAGTATCIFAPGWTFEKSTGYADFLARDRKLWIGTAASDCGGRATGGVAQFVPPRSVASVLPLATNFDLGRGKGFSVGGSPVSTAPWSNLGLQGLLPTRRFCLSGASTSRLSASLDQQSPAFDGGASLLLQFENPTGQESAACDLFSLQIPLTGEVSLRWVFQPLDARAYPVPSLVAIVDDRTAITLSGAARPLRNGWLEASGTLSATGRTLTGLLLQLEPSPTGGIASYGLRLGAVSAAPRGWVGPSSVSGLQARGASWSAGSVTTDLLWSYPAGAARFFDVWQLHGDGSASWIVRTACLAAWVSNVAPGPRDGGRVTLGVCPTDFAGAMQPTARCASVTLTP